MKGAHLHTDLICMIANIETAFATVLKLSEVTIYNVNDTGNLETIAQSLL